MSELNKFVGVFQFTHPGSEHTKGTKLPECGVYFKRWNWGGHHRKYIRCKADIVDANDSIKKGESVDFWGEWEPESLVVPLPATDDDKERPNNIHYPVFIKDDTEYEGNNSIVKKIIEEKKKEQKKADRLQNTDPFIFGENFYYTCCKQYQTKRLEPGSIILFGSTFKDPDRDRYVIDTVFVISEIIECTADGIEKYRDRDPANGLFYDAVLHKIYYGSGSQDKNKNWSEGNKIIVGASYENRYEGMYSFFPCHPSTNKKRYKRPVIDSSLHEKISSSLMSQGAYIIQSGIDDTKVFWKNLRDLVLEQGYCLGVKAELPPKRTPEEVPKYIKTVEKLQAFFIVKDLLKSVVPMSDISYKDNESKDNESYMTIIYKEKITKWVCRLYFNSANKFITIPDENKNKIKYYISDPYDIEKYADKLIEAMRRYL